MNLISTIVDNYIVYVFGSFWLASLFFIAVSVFVMSKYNVSYTNQTYVVLISTILFLDVYLGQILSQIILIALSLMAALVVTKKFMK